MARSLREELFLRLPFQRQYSEGTFYIYRIDHYYLNDTHFTEKNLDWLSVYLKLLCPLHPSLSHALLASPDLVGFRWSVDPLKGRSVALPPKRKGKQRRVRTITPSVSKAVKQLFFKCFECRIRC